MCNVHNEFDFRFFANFLHVCIQRIERLIFKTKKETHDHELNFVLLETYTGNSLTVKMDLRHFVENLKYLYLFVLVYSFRLS